MNREQQIIEKLKQALNKVSDDLKGYRVFLFGSRAAGKAGRRSDFDVGILGQKKLSLRTFYRIDDLFDRIETLYKIDLVDLSEVTDRFRREALKKTEILYG